MATFAKPRVLPDLAIGCRKGTKRLARASPEEQRMRARGANQNHSSVVTP